MTTKIMKLFEHGCASNLVSNGTERRSHIFTTLGSTEGGHLRNNLLFKRSSLGRVHFLHLGILFSLARSVLSNYLHTSLCSAATQELVCHEQRDRGQYGVRIHEKVHNHSQYRHHTDRSINQVGHHARSFDGQHRIQNKHNGDDYFRHRHIFERGHKFHIIKSSIYYIVDYFSQI